VTELALDHIQGDAFAGHLDGVRVAQLVGREASAHTGLDGEPTQVSADCAGHPPPLAGWAFDDAEQPADRQLRSLAEPGTKLFPAPVVHADLAALAALAAPYQQRSATLVEIGRSHLVGGFPAPYDEESMTRLITDVKPLLQK